MEFPRADQAIIVDAQSWEVKEVEAGETKNALYYELLDMEEAVKNHDTSLLHLQESRDVMRIMTKLRKDWQMKYPNEIW